MTSIERYVRQVTFSFQPPHDKTNKNDCAPSEDLDQPRHPPSPIRVIAVCMKQAWILSYPLSAQRNLWSDWADAQADLSLRWAHMPFCWFCLEAAHLSMTLLTLNVAWTIIVHRCKGGGRGMALGGGGCSGYIFMWCTKKSKNFPTPQSHWKKKISTP